MKGFTNYVYNGMPVFIRDEYESVNGMLSEEERLADIIGVYYSNVNVSLYSIEAKKPNLVYRKMNNSRDNQLRNYETWQQCWIPFESGWVHRITGEYVKGDKPTYDSYPCWCKCKFGTSPGYVEYKSGPSGSSDLLIGIAILLSIFN